MKKKLDFVTNSSSCAFIFIGWVLDTGDKVNEIVKEQMEIFGTKEYDPALQNYENLYEVYDGKVDITLGDGENGLPDNKLCIGMSKRIHDDDYETHEFTIQDVFDIDDKLAESFDAKDIKIISGMEVC
jgi:hypothetical protein